MPTQSTIWLMTEEAPKVGTVADVLLTYCERNGIHADVDAANLKIEPIWDSDWQFTGEYRVAGSNIDGHSEIRIGFARGTGSMIDYLVYDQDDHPVPADQPDLAIEETKTQDNKSRNVSTCQRLTKFSMIDQQYPNVDTVMLYNENSLNPSRRQSIPASSARGIKMMRTMGVSVVGAERYEQISGYDSLQELIDDNKVPASRSGNIPFTVNQTTDDTIIITAKLSKGEHESICHDPNEGLVIGTVEAIRELGFEGDVVIRSHCATQDAVNRMRASNKFFSAADRLGISLEGIDLPTAPKDEKLPYWHTEHSSEKIASILMEVMATNNGYERVFANHAGCERGYLRGADGQEYEVPTSFDKIPDLVLYNKAKNHLIVVEGKQLHTLEIGKSDIAKMGEFNDFLCALYPDINPTSDVDTTISIYGGEEDTIPDASVSFYVTDDGRVMMTDLCSDFASPYGIKTSIPNTTYRARAKTTRRKAQKAASSMTSSKTRRSEYIIENGVVKVWVEPHERCGTKVKGHWRRISKLI